MAHAHGGELWDRTSTFGIEILQTFQNKTLCIMVKVFLILKDISIPTNYIIISANRIQRQSPSWIRLPLQLSSTIIEIYTGEKLKRNIFGEIS